MVCGDFFEQCSQKRNLAQLNFAILYSTRCSAYNTEVAGDLFVGDLTAVEGAVQIDRRIDMKLPFLMVFPLYLVNSAMLSCFL